MALKLFCVVPHNGRPTRPPTGVELLPMRGLAAAVERVPSILKEVGQADIERHATVVQGMFDRDVVLPAPVGTTFRSQESLEHWLDLHHVTLSDALGWLSGRCCVRVHVKKADAAETADTKTVEEILRQLAAQAVASVPLRSEGATLGSASFLVERAVLQEFTAAVTQIAEKHQDLRVESSGPWPPHDFVRLQFVS